MLFIFFFFLISIGGNMDPYFQNENEDGPEFLTMEDFQPLMGTSSSFL